MVRVRKGARLGASGGRGRFVDGVIDASRWGAMSGPKGMAGAISALVGDGFVASGMVCAVISDILPSSFFAAVFM